MLSRHPATYPVGHSLAIREIVAKIDKLALNRWPVLLLGETGTGKEVVARAIYGRNPMGPFVTIDCSALVGPLMESELFGHAKGAFTGAVNAKTGLIEAANGGTAFFDEIGELPLDLQGKLLRVLLQKEFRPVGALSVRRSDFRIIAATNRELAQEVEKGRFRQDLYYRLNVTKLRLPRLRDRKEDIPELIQHFLANIGESRVLGQETVDELLSYDWPGNVRELEHCIHHMIATNTERLLRLGDLPSSVQNHGRERRAVIAVAAAGARTAHTPPAEDFPPARLSSPEPVRMPVPLVELERRAILEALEYTKGDRAVAAMLLGIGRTTLYRKLREYGV